MNEVILRCSAYYTEKEETQKQLEKLFPHSYAVNSDDIQKYSQDPKFMKNEAVAINVMYPAAKCLEQSKLRTELIPERSGLVLGSFYGCADELYEAHKRISIKAEKGITPKYAVNIIPYGMSSKIAIKLNFKSFNHSIFSGKNSGTDSVISAYELMKQTHSVHALACAGDNGNVCSSLMLEHTDCKSGDAVIKGFAKGCIYGDNTDDQLDYLLKAAAMTAGIDLNEISFALISDNTNIAYDKLSHSFSAGCTVINDTALELPEDTGCSAGILYIMYCIDKIQKGKNGIVIQLDESGAFSSLIIGKAE